MAILLRTKALLVAAGLLFSLAMQAQEFSVIEGSISACEGFFTDSGGIGDGYSANENHTVTICSDNSSGSHIRLVFANIEIAQGDTICFYDGLDTNAPSLQCVNDTGFDGSFIVQATAANPSGCLTVAFSSNASEEAAGWAAEIFCVQECQTIISELVSTTPAVMPADTGWIDICPGDRVSLSAQGLYPQNGVIYQHSDLTSTFEWTFGDGTTAVGPNVTHEYDEAGGYIIQLTITDERGCQSTNFINQRVRVAPKPDFMLGDVPDEICSGDSISLRAIVDNIDSSFTVSASPNEASFQAGAVRSDSLALPDGTGASYETSVSFQDFRPGQVVTTAQDIESICLNIEHTWIRDLEISLRCPNGQSIVLHNFGGRSGAEVFLGEPIDFDGTNPNPGSGYEYCWTNEGNQTWLEYANANTPSTLPAGDYRPYDDFSNLIGCPLNGEWTIEVEDLWRIDNGFIFSWGISFNPDLFPDLEKFTPQIVDFGWQDNPTIYNAAPTEIEAAPTNAGAANFVFETVDEFGCTFDTSINVSVLPVTHPNCRDCNELLIPQADTVVCEGDPVAFDVARQADEEATITFESFPNYIFGNGNHPPTNPYNAIIDVNSIAPATINNALEQIESVCIDLETDWLEDVEVALVAPDGSLLELTSNNGGTGDFYQQTCFTPDATTPITSGSSPFNGNFQPEGNWSALNNAPTNGAWSLRLADGGGVIETGTLNAWSITFNSTNVIEYNWQPATGLSCADCPNPVATPDQTTTYIVEAADSYNCTSMDTITVNVISDAPAPDVSCDIQGDTAMLFDWMAIPGVVNYEVNLTVNGQASGWQGPIGETQYLVEGLQNLDSVTLDVRAFTGGIDLDCNVEIGSSTCIFIVCELDLVSITSTPVDCFGNNTGTATVEVAGGVGDYSYLWDDTLRQIEQTAIFLEAGNYNVTVTDEAGCIAFAEVTVAQPDQIVIDSEVTDALCVGDANGQIVATASGGMGNFTFGWSTGQTGNTATGLAVGDYTVSVTDDNGCVATSTIAVAEPDTALSVALDQTRRGCYATQGNEAMAMPIGGTGPDFAYRWSDGQATQTAVNLDSINYAVTVTDANGCTATNDIKLQDLEPITMNLIGRMPTCSGDTNGALGVNIVTGGAGNSERDYTFRWSTGQTGNAIEDLAGGVTYSVTATDVQGCQGVRARLLEEPAPVSFDVEITEPLCSGNDDGAAALTNLSGQGNNFTFQWGQNAKNQRTPTAINLIAGNYSVTVTDEQGCESDASIVVTEPTPIQATFETVDNRCFGEGEGAITTTASGGTPGYTFAWSNGITTANQQNLQAGNYELTVTDANGCEHIAATEIRHPDRLTATLTATDASCAGDRDGSIRIAPMGGTAPYQYSLDNQNFSSNSNLIGLTADTYKVYVRDANGCTFLDRVEVNEPPEFIVDAGDNSYTILLGDSLQLNATSANGQGFISYVWSAPYGNTLSCSECETVIAKPEDMIIYELYGLDERGCEATDKVTVVVQKIRTVDVPTGFTPNNDGTNDRLRVHGREGTRVTMFRVYDRWGELLFETGDFMVNDENKGWDGTFRGEPMSAGVYIWYAEVEYIDGMTETLNGQTTLIR
jgi:gliding motility-associated-like protein